MEDIAQQLLRALRGTRSQVAFARRLGYAGNVVAKWEGGHRFPTATETLRAATVVGVDVNEAFAAFHPQAHERAESQLGGATWLTALKGSASQRDLAARSGLSRQAVGRALRGASQPRLPAWLALVEAATGRVGDLVALLVDIEAVPALAARVARVRGLRRMAFDKPWTAGALAVLDALPPTTSTRQRVASVARCLGLGTGQAAALVQRLKAVGALDVSDNAPGLTVDMAPSAEDHQRLRAHWANVASQRVADGRDDDVFSYNVFAVSRQDLAQIRELQRAFFRSVRAIVKDSQPEVAAFLTVHTGALEPCKEDPGATRCGSGQAGIPPPT